MNKFGRNYSLYVQNQTGGTLNVNYPLTLEFDITRATYASAQMAKFRIYNLSKNHRNQIRKDQYDTNTYFQLIVNAGYGNNLATIFKGNVVHSWSTREGDNFITSIEAMSGGFAFANPQTNIVFPPGTQNSNIITTLADALPHTTLGSIGSFNGSTPRGASFSEPATDVLNHYTGGESGWFIDNEIVHALNPNEVIAQSDILTINASSGLLNTPYLENNFLYFDFIFEPRLFLGQLINLQSTTEFIFQGQAKVISVQHKGTISGAICGDAITTVGLDIYTNNFVQVPTASVS